MANIYLDAFDKFMMERGHRIVRYADDILILCRSKSAAVNALRQASRYLEEELRLTVNREKTHIGHSARGANFLGVTIHSSYTRIKRAKLNSFKAKVKAMTRRNIPVNLAVDGRDEAGLIKPASPYSMFSGNYPAHAGGNCSAKGDDAGLEQEGGYFV